MSLAKDISLKYKIIFVTNNKQKIAIETKKIKYKYFCYPEKSYLKNIVS